MLCDHIHSRVGIGSRLDRCYEQLAGIGLPEWEQARELAQTGASHPSPVAVAIIELGNAKVAQA